MTHKQKIILVGAMTAALSACYTAPAAAYPRLSAPIQTLDELQVYDQRTIDSAGAFLLGELERLDQTLNMPLAEVSWSRDIELREDVSMGDEVSSFTNSDFAAAGGASPGGKNWIGKDTNTIKGLALDIKKTANPLTLWGMEIGYTLPELESAQRAGRPVDAQKIEGMNLKLQMDIDEQVYIGDSTLGYTGLVNNANVSLANAVTGAWSNVATTADTILNDVNVALGRAWTASAYRYVPTDMLVDPLSYAQLVSRKVSTAGNVNIMQYLKDNSLSMAKNGRPLNIQPVKWLLGAGTSGTNRFIVYTKNKKLVRFPMVPTQRTPLEYRGIYQLTYYFNRLGVVEWVYPETGAYTDGV